MVHSRTIGWGGTSVQFDARKRFKLLGELPNVEFGHSFSRSPLEGLKPIPDGTCLSSPYSPLYARSTAATPKDNSPGVLATGDVSHIYFLRRFCLQDGNEVGQNTQQEQSRLQKRPRAVLFCLMRFEYNVADVRDHVDRLRDVDVVRKFPLAALPQSTRNEAEHNSQQSEPKHAPRLVPPHRSRFTTWVTQQAPGITLSLSAWLDRDGVDTTTTKITEFDQKRVLTKDALILSYSRRPG
ncbi:unnamed protein product, partial [Ectocarpus sp. 8 AP-2014]